MPIQRSLDTLSQDDVRVARRGRFTLASRALAQGNGLHDVALGVAPTGAGQLFFFPHDHGPRGGGVALPRGCVYSADYGDGDDYAFTFLVADEWRKIDRDATRRIALNSTGTPDVEEPAHFVAYASPGIDRNTTARSSNPCAWEAQMLVQFSDAAETVAARWYNRRTGTYSSTDATTGTTDPQWLEWTDIPVAGGELSELDLHLRCTSINDNFRILSLTISETRRNSQPESQGTRNAGVSAPIVSP